MGGIKAKGLKNVRFELDGTLLFSKHIKRWPRHADKAVFECIEFDGFENVTFTSNGKGTIDGNGKKWWGLPGIGYLIRVENRPRLFNIGNSKNIIFENILLRQSPYWTFWGHEVDGLEIRYSDIDNRVNGADWHDTLNLLGALNTDGFDVTGNNVWIHHCNVWCQDDTFTIKDNSTNMVVENVNASGIGLTIGSIADSIV